MIGNAKRCKSFSGLLKKYFFVEKWQVKVKYWCDHTLVFDINAKIRFVWKNNRIQSVKNTQKGIEKEQVWNLYKSLTSQDSQVFINHCW